MAGEENRMVGSGDISNRCILRKWPELRNHALEMSDFLLCFSRGQEKNFEWCWTKIVWLEAEIRELWLD